MTADMLDWLAEGEKRLRPIAGPRRIVQFRGPTRSSIAKDRGRLRLLQTGTFRTEPTGRLEAYTGTEPLEQDHHLA